MNRYGGFTDWTIAVLVSILLNIILFGLMPALIRISPQNQEMHNTLKPVPIIMIKHRQMPLQSKEIKQKNSLNKYKVKFKNFIKVFKQKTVVLKPELSFDMNTKFILNPVSSSGTTGPGSLPVMNFNMTGPVLKGNYQIGELDNPLIPIVKIPPIYPAMAMRNNIEGWVKVRFLVTDKGQVKNIHIVKAVPGKIFNNSVIRCVSRWKFKPGTVGGIPVNTMAETSIKFKLEQ